MYIVHHIKKYSQAFIKHAAITDMRCSIKIFRIKAMPITMMPHFLQPLYRSDKLTQHI